MRAQRAVKRITFNPFEANPGQTLYVHVPKLNQNEVIVPNSFALIFDIDLSGGHANNFLVQNVLWALMDKLVVKFVATTLDETVGYDIKTFQDLFLPAEKHDNMVPEGILLLFVKPYNAGARDSEKYIFPDLKKVSVMINGSSNMLYNNSIESQDILSEVSRFFMKEKYKPQHMNLQKFYSDN